MATLNKDQVLLDGEVFDRRTLLEQTERVTESRHFRNSKRYPMLLRFVVEQAIAGKAEELKERTLGMDVFARAGDYDTNTDPIVRVTAGEVRKRLAQYYHEAGHETEIRIELPVGAYVPHFLRPEVLAAPDRATEAVAEMLLPVIAPAGSEHLTEPLPDNLPALTTDTGVRRWPRWLIPALAVACAVAIGLLVVMRQREDRAGDLLWRPTLGSANPIAVVIGVHSFNETGQERQPSAHEGDGAGAQGPEDMLDAAVRQDMVPVSDLVSYSRVTDLLARHGRQYQTSSSAEATIEDVRRGPLVLIGGLDNIWTLRLTSRLRFHFEQRLQTENGIVDSQHPETVWRFNNMQDAAATTRDFALVASYFDSTIDQPVVVIAGVGKAGTEVAAEFATSRTGMEEWARKKGLAGAGRDVEFVLATDILDGKAGPPRVVASAVW